MSVVILFSLSIFALLTCLHPQVLVATSYNWVPLLGLTIAGNCPEKILFNKYKYVMFAIVVLIFLLVLMTILFIFRKSISFESFYGGVCLERRASAARYIGIGALDGDKSKVTFLLDALNQASQGPMQSFPIQDKRNVPESTYENSIDINSPSYMGGFLTVNDPIPGSSVGLRSEELKNDIRDACYTNLNNIAKMYPDYRYDDMNQWNSFGSGWGLSHEMTRDFLKRYTSRGARLPVTIIPAHNGNYNPKSTSRLNAPLAGFGGPCLWCSRGIGSYIPDKVPLPYTGNTDAVLEPSVLIGGGLSVSTTTSSFVPLITEHKFSLPKLVRAGLNFSDDTDWRWYGCNMADLHDWKLPIALQPNGGVQVAWTERTADGKNNGSAVRVHVTYINKGLTEIVNEFVVEAFDVGGLCAFDDGTALLVNQMDCDAPSSREPNASYAKGVLIYWKNGKLQWARSLTDPYRKNSQVDPYIESKEGDGYYTGGAADGTHLVYDNIKKQFAAYFRVTGGRGGHWGSNVYYVNINGDVTYEVGACSHDILGRMLPDPNGGDFQHICCDDGNGLKMTSTPFYPDIVELPKSNSELSINFAAARPCSFIARRGTAKQFFFAYLNKYQRYYYGMTILQIEADKLTSSRRLIKQHEYYLNNPSHQDYFNFHLMPYGKSASQQKETYLIHYEVLDMTQHECCNATMVTEDRCGGDIKHRVYQIMEFKDGDFVKYTEPMFVDNMAMQNEQTPAIYPNGDILWACYEKNMLVIRKLRNVWVD
jgi:hypothetical protein